MMTRTIGIRGTTRLALALSALALLATATTAQANKVTYTGIAHDVKPGQSKGLPVFAQVVVSGPRCPSGPHCFDRAKITELSGVDWAYPNCPEVLDGGFTLTGPFSFTRSKPHRFSISGQSDEHFEKVEFGGTFIRHGNAVKGWYKVDSNGYGCTTGRLNWVATLDK